jgi:hypothetical protein
MSEELPRRRKSFIDQFERQKGRDILPVFEDAAAAVNRINTPSLTPPETPDTQLDMQVDTKVDVQLDAQLDVQQDAQLNAQLPVGRSVGRPVGRSDTQVSREGDTQVDAQASGHSTAQTSEQGRGQAPSGDYTNPIAWLKDDYAKVLTHMIQNLGNITSHERISQATTVPFGTVRRAVRTLVMLGFITKPHPYSRGKIKGFSFNIITAKCDQFLQERGHASGHSSEQATEHGSERPVGCPVECSPSDAPFSSSSFSKETTTKARVQRSWTATRTCVSGRVK